ncbi:MAG TPA: NADP(H)-dependent aldo-keto reductase [Saprospiraceae bacterium]|nr:NADP(H)-dependent aldo-keto reductase [Saprospiraceae bacterium]
MIYTTLGNTDTKVSKICLGTMTFGEQNSETDAHQQLNYAVDQGVNFIDTAEMYAVPGRKETLGLTEKYIGTWLKDRKDRDQLVVATKIVGPSAGLLYIRNPLQYTPEQINIALEGSLRNLQTDYIDLYQLHWPERKTNFFGKLDYEHNENDPWTDNFLEILETLDALVKAGKIRHFGISNETPWGMMNFLRIAEKHDLPKCVSIQNPYNLLNRSFEVGLAEMAIREKVGLLAYSPMAFGLLSGKYHKGVDSPDYRINKYQQLNRYNASYTRDAAAKYLEIAERHELSFAQMSLAFVTSRPFTTSTIIGATTMTQLKENISSIELELSGEILKEINAVHTAHSNPAP